jgi:prepilin-type N-terminal cleavage/methylation domain-containing protein
VAGHWNLADALRHPDLAAPEDGRAPLRAFTLMEIMIVVGIMGIALTMGVPLVWKVWHKAPMNKAISEMVELCSTARARAILQGVQTQLVLHGNGGITIEGGAGSAPATVTGVLSPGMPASSSGGPTTSTHLPDGVAIFKFLVGGVDCMQLESARVRFFPNGTCDDFVMQLVSDRAERVEISLEVTTSLASVERDWGKFRIR